MARNEFGMEGPDQGWEEVGPFRFRPRGSDRNTTNATAPPKTRRAQNLRPPTNAASAERTHRRRHPVGRNWAPMVPVGTCTIPPASRPPNNRPKFGGARPHRRRLPWVYDCGRENPSICAAAERWPLWAAAWPRPIRLWTPTYPATGFPATAAAAPTHGTRRRRHRSCGGSSRGSAGSGRDHPL